VPHTLFSRWAAKSNPFKYLAPHYLDIIFRCLADRETSPKIEHIDGRVNSITFCEKPEVTALVSAALELYVDGKRILIDAVCNWMEPDSLPFSSRQEVEFLSEKAHLFSEQASRGQRFYSKEKAWIPNPEFHIPDSYHFAAGYGPQSIEEFLQYVDGGMKDELIPLSQYEPVSRVVDFVSHKLNMVKTTP